MPTPKLTPEYASDLWSYLYNDRWGQIRVIQERLDKLFFNRHDLGFKAKEAKELLAGAEGKDAETLIRSALAVRSGWPQ